MTVRLRAGWRVLPAPSHDARLLSLLRSPLLLFLAAGLTACELGTGPGVPTKAIPVWVYGTVTDASTGAAVAGATVLPAHASPTTTTRKDGAYLSRGTYSCVLDGESCRVAVWVGVLHEDFSGPQVGGGGEATVDLGWEVNDLVTIRVDVALTREGQPPVSAAVRGGEK